MRVIKHGKKEFTVTCPRCGCVFAYTLEELCERWPLKFIRCPDCEEGVYHKEQEAEAISDSNISPGGNDTTTSDNCPVCGSIMFCDHSVVYTSNPPKYKWICPKCGFSRYTYCGAYNSYTGTADPFTHKYDSVTITGSDVNSSSTINKSLNAISTCKTSTGVWSE